MLAIPRRRVARTTVELIPNKQESLFLSHEHSDHFDIQSLNLLPRSAKFVVGATIVEPVKQCIRDLGFTLT